jgi:KUP system potassium uptake protein
VSVLPVPRVEDVDRYVVGRVDSLPGFYGVEQYIGFRDEPALYIDEIVTKISQLETRLDPVRAEQIMSQLGEYSRRPTHVCAFPVLDLRVNVHSIA